jgi:outer membrane protein
MVQNKFYPEILAIAFLLTVVSISGRTTTQTRSQGDGSEERDERVQWSVGGGFVASPRPYLGSDAKVIPIPVVGLRYKRWFVQGIRGGYDVIEKGAFTGSLFAQARFRGLEPEASAFLEGMEPRKKSADAGGELAYRGRPIGFRAAFVSDALGRSNGQEFSAVAVTGAPLGRFLILLGAGPHWLSAKRVDYYYGVRKDEVRPGRPAYVGNSTWNLDINLTVNVKITEKWRLFTIVNREGFGSGITDSPLVDRSSAFAMVTSLTYNF